MLKTSAIMANSKFLSFCSLLFLSLTLSGCATRALMSSDRYEKPEPETKQYHSGAEILQRPPADMLKVEQAFVTAMTQDNL
jgi:outer membrane lipoprotein SlyB